MIEGWNQQLGDGKQASKPQYEGRPLALDPDARSARADLPAFLARPDDAPVYHGFPVLADVTVDGFSFGMITDFEGQPDTEGDAFVVAPDGSRAGLVWEVTEREYFDEVYPATAARWGVWAVSFPYPMDSRANARRNLAAVLPRLRACWQAWCDQG
jgi:hypothetical protein